MKVIKIEEGLDLHMNFEASVASFLNGFKKIKYPEYTGLIKSIYVPTIIKTGLAV